jgi:hypothetical protein
MTLGIAVPAPTLNSAIVPISIVIIVVLVPFPNLPSDLVPRSTIWHKVYISCIRPHRRSLVRSSFHHWNNQHHKPRSNSISGL